MLILSSPARTMLLNNSPHRRYVVLLVLQTSMLALLQPCEACLYPMSVYDVLYLDLHLSFAREDIVAQIRRGIAVDQCFISDNLNFPKEPLN